MNAFLTDAMGCFINSRLDARYSLENVQHPTANFSPAEALMMRKKHLEHVVFGQFTHLIAGVKYKGFNS